MSSRAKRSRGIPWIWRTGFASRSKLVLLHQIQHCSRHSDNSCPDRWFGNRGEFTRMQGGQFLPRLPGLGDLRWLDRPEVKINRWDGMIRQAVFRKIVAAHRWIDDLDIFVA